MSRSSPERPGRVVPNDRVSVNRDHYVSRAAHKSLGALDDLGLSVSGRVLDAGASTGGFTQVLLERGCTEVIAIDVGTDQLVTSLRDDDRVRLWSGRICETSIRAMSTAGRSIWSWQTCPSSRC